MNYCSQCAQAVDFRIPEGDTLPRHICDHCGTIHYINPKIIVGCLAEWEGQVLICKRAIEPRHGLWTLPAGFMEREETAAEGAARETMEEAQATVRDPSLYAVLDVPQISQLYLIYRGTLVDGAHHPGPESLETKLVHPADIPWESLAFPTMQVTLQHYVDTAGADLTSTGPLTKTIRRPARKPR
ncbi:NUDIX hydrolase [Abyssibacter sp.]|jgi:ADP-ribose pyrophosphatase YjhB (NUDIX family)|uniref:NUDIX hydrolase n=1 Tax=Abyssibacter sp. TaxID=2320200 RepID=UPI000C35C2BA|nr:NUDIX hydrolase [Abyssibacter sp.]MBB86456.1 NUDIX hydrolase [Xanthomonadales bacterium]MBB88537.1 NUDIX hydrolase [Xanthomonadales bacterium]MCK5858733.1 NUDIX hydrolase [Abyssibacter sp.]